MANQDKVIASQAKRIDELETALGESRFQVVEILGLLDCPVVKMTMADLIDEVYQEVVKIKSRVATLEAALELERLHKEKKLCEDRPATP